ncbi:hypothetical protein RHSIM_Rhsim03G0200900 [Rhododendron simsii]|uniref:Uncharacterized protein n=1 Tax=Rhododendron simsii TaxID=118357 RepID=A0A834HFX3_RHOSS|nr:hypothetical protein RHSIM_Rhsim03G0200900 [Rhododendron simsii]
MALGASSICVVTRQTANPRDLTSANFWGKFTHFPCKLQFKRPVLTRKSAHLIALQRRNPTQGNVVFVISNENDEAGGGISHACTDRNSNPGDEVVSLVAVTIRLLSKYSYHLLVTVRKYWLNAANLIHYLAVQDLEVDQLKADLSSIGILSLEAIYSDVFAGLFADNQI